MSFSYVGQEFAKAMPPGEGWPDEAKIKVTSEFGETHWLSVRGPILLEIQNLMMEDETET